MEHFILLGITLVAFGFLYWANKRGNSQAGLIRKAFFDLLENPKPGLKITTWFIGAIPLVEGLLDNRPIKLELSGRSGRSLLVATIFPSSIPLLIPALSFRFDWPKITENCCLRTSDIIGTWDLSNFNNHVPTTEEAKAILAELLNACRKVETGQYKL